MIIINGKKYYLKTKRELFTDEFQEILRKSYRRKERTGNRYVEKIFCACRARLYTAHLNKKNLYVLRTYPKETGRHRPSCIFHKDNADTFIEDSNEIVIASENLLFKTGSIIKNTKSSKTKPVKNGEYKEILGFNHLIFLLIDEAYSLVFNYTNKGTNRLSGNIKNVPTKEFIRFFKKIVHETKIKNGGTIEMALKKNNAFLYIDILTEYEEEENFIRYKTINKDEYIHLPKKIWDKAVRFAKIYNSVISPPYLLLKISKNRKTIRFFIMPVANTDTFIPVESNKERIIANKLVEDYKAIYKPLTTTSIKRVLTKDIAREFYKAVSPDTRPDFFVFKKNNIEVIEVVDENNRDPEYLERLKEKEAEYKKLSTLFFYRRLIL
ncbi:hypothetical protein [Persephonella sp.]